MSTILPTHRIFQFLPLVFSLLFIVDLSAKSKESCCTQEKTSFQILRAENDSILSQALTLQLKCDSMRDQLLIQRNLYSASTQTDERQKLKSSIQVLESSIHRCQEQADELFRKTQYNQPAMTSAPTKSVAQYLIEISQPVNNIPCYQFFPVPFLEGSDTSIVENRNIQNSFTLQIGTTYFAIMDQTPYSANKPIPAMRILPEGLVYCVQLGVYSKSLAIESFGGLVPCWLELMEDHTKRAYFTGLFSSSKEAREALILIQNIGFKDAFILPYLNGRKISIQEAREFEFSEKNLIR